MASVVRMPLQDGERAVDLLQQDDACQVVGQGHLPQRELEGGCLAGSVAEAVGGSHAEEKLLRAAVLLLAKEVGELLRSKFSPAGVEQYKSCPVFFCQLKQGDFAAQ